MLIKVTRRCGHTGITSDGRLPCELRCWSCGSSHRVEPNGDARIVSTERRLERANAIIEVLQENFLKHLSWHFCIARRNTPRRS
jgi:hypothetical protein